MTDFSWTEDGILRTPCASWCSLGCDGTVHASDSVSVHVGRRPFGKDLVVCIAQQTNDRYPSISLEDERSGHEGTLTADEAENLANVLLDHVKILRADAQEVDQ